MDLQKQFGKDEELVEKGVWEDLGDARVRIRYNKNEDYQNYLRQRAQNLNQLPGQDIQDDVAEDLIIEGHAKYILVDWENLKIDGEEIEYNEDNARMVLEEFDEFRDYVMNYASNLANYKQDNEEQDIKN